MSDDQIIQKYTQEYTRYLVKLAQDNLLSGIIEEPRVFYDEIVIPAFPIEGVSGSNIFKNGERFPVRLTHMTLIPRLTAADGDTLVAEQVIQRMGLSLRFHDEWYMNDLFVAAPNWCTMPTATPPGINESTASWRFCKPLVYGTRDTFDVQVGLIVPPEADDVVPVNVTFTGVGIESMRPYFFNNQIGLLDTAMRSIPTGPFRNDGAEPVLITDMIVNTGASANGQPQDTGNIRNIRVQVRQTGNGTGGRWMIGPTAPSALGVCAANLGVMSGRCIVHEFPGNGLLWEPGEGIDCVVRALDQLAGGTVLSIALAGYISVQ